MTNLTTQDSTQTNFDPGPMPGRLGEVIAGGGMDQEPQTSSPDLGEWGQRFKSFTDLADDESWKNAPLVAATCPKCQGQHYRNAALLASGPGLACDDCADAYFAEKKNPAFEPANAPTLELPPLFLATDKSHKDFPREIWDKVKDFNPGGDRGVILRGGTGGGKTRLLCLLAQRCVLTYRKTAKIFWAGEFQSEAVDRLRSDKSFNAWKRELRNVDFLCFDDLFSGRFTERIESALFDVLDERMRWQKPLGVTTNKSGEDVRGGALDKQRAEAINRRLGDTCDLYTVSTQETFIPLGGEA
jgi:hypothetical protein